nr:hypothetical protein [Tanacetum cinerariifolium]
MVIDGVSRGKKLLKEILIQGNAYHQKEKIQAKPDKTEHEMKRRGKVKSQPKSTPTKLKPPSQANVTPHLTPHHKTSNPPWQSLASLLVQEFEDFFDGCDSLEWCGNSLDGIFCQRCTCKYCGKGAHYVYNYLPKVLNISNPEPYHDQNVEEFPQNLPSFHPACYSGDENSFSYDLTPNLVNDSPNVFNLPSQPPMYSYEFCGDDAHYRISHHGDEHLDTIPEKESDAFIKSSVENLVPNPSESEDERECDVPDCDNFTTFSNLLFDADDDFSSSDNESISDEDIPKEIYSNPFFDEDIISIKIDLHHLNAKSDLIESLLNQDSLIIYSSKIDSLLDEFKLLYDNSSPRPPEELIFENSDAAIESFSPSPIPVEDSDSLMEEIDLFLTPNDSMPSGIEDDDYDSEGDILILEELLSNDSLSLPENELLPTQPTLASNQEKAPHLLSHRGLKAFQLSSESPMMIYGGNIPILDVLFLHFYPP